ncbi:unnamed protein product [Enterobius vermicularis]|uniref:CMP/dCMP-type deaminase domain-containing protein n=1 Tax=Enterobius vermicularis TaxID=51028 RepID=A0A0N4VM99_ENTVE|nr:unnamed protein product [Enterobius vermicularis]
MVEVSGKKFDSFNPCKACAKWIWDSGCNDNEKSFIDGVNAGRKEDKFWFFSVGNGDDVCSNDDVSVGVKEGKDDDDDDVNDDDGVDDAFTMIEDILEDVEEGQQDKLEGQWSEKVERRKKGERFLLER